MKWGHRLHRAFSLVELILFLGLLAIIMTTVTTVYIATQEARIRQQFTAEIEQRGIQLVDLFAQMVRRSEAILAPSAGHSGSILALQMAANVEFPTIVTATSSGSLFIVQKTNTAALTTPRLQARNLRFSTLGDANVVLSFDLQTTIPTVPASIYLRHFEGTATLFPDDQSDAGGCDSCPLPVCDTGQYRWYHCQNDVCELSPVTFACP